MADVPTGDLVLGLTLVVVAGCLNGSWNAAFSPTLGLAVGRNPKNKEDVEQKGSGGSEPDVTPDLTFHLSWVLFQFYAALINIPICIWWAGGPERVGYIVQESSALDIALVAIFSLLWGLGSVGFGMACKIAGVGLGTNLCMGVIMVLGTLLPLCMDGAIATPAGGVVVGGLAVCCCGLVCSILSLRERDAAERAMRIRRRTLHNTTVSLSFHNLKDATSGELEASALEETATGNGNQVPPEKDTSNPSDTDQDESTEPSTLYKVGVCIVAGIFATQLQFAFVFGDDMVTLAEDNSQGPGYSPPSGTGAIIWLFAITLGAPASVVYGLYNKPSDVPISRFWKCPWYRHLLIIVTTCIPFLSHIHLYGYSTTLLPEDMGTSVAWPSLMMVTVVTGMIWSVVLGEWKDAPELAWRKLYQGLAFVTVGIGIIMVSVAL